MILKIVSCQYKPFTPEEGGTMDYYWIKAEKLDGLIMQFGSKKDYSGRVGEKLDIPIEGNPDKNGKMRYKEST